MRVQSQDCGTSRDGRKRHVTTGYRGDRGKATIEELWEDVFSVQSAPELYNWSSFEFPVSLRKEILGPD
jgi:hypothetical protein